MDHRGRGFDAQPRRRPRPVRLLDRQSRDRKTPARKSSTPTSRSRRTSDDFLISPQRQRGLPLLALRADKGTSLSRNRIHEIPLELPSRCLADRDRAGFHRGSRRRGPALFARCLVRQGTRPRAIGRCTAAACRAISSTSRRRACRRRGTSRRARTSNGASSWAAKPTAGRSWPAAASSSAPTTTSRAIRPSRAIRAS